MSQGQFNEMSSRMRTMAHDWSVGSGCGKGKGKGKQLEDIASKGKGKDTNTEPLALANIAHCPATALQTWAVHVYGDCSLYVQTMCFYTCHHTRIYRYIRTYTVCDMVQKACWVYVCDIAYMNRHYDNLKKLCTIEEKYSATVQQRFSDVSAKSASCPAVTQDHIRQLEARMTFIYGMVVWCAIHET
jgi:hypothetical protein